mgnify:CR=1 FL=1
MTLFIGILFFHYFYTGRQVSQRIYLVILGVFGLTLVSYLLNLPDSSLIIFFPVIGLTYMSLIGEEASFLDLFYWALFIHILFGAFLVISSYVVGMNPYVHPMYDKGLPFLHAAKGFTTTVQAYGTLVISWFLIFYFKKENHQIYIWDKLAYGLVFLGLILTFNRNSFLVFYLILFFKHKRFFWATVFLAFGLYLYFFEFINKLIFNLSTISSRADLLQAFRIAFFEQTDWLGYLIGHGNNMVAEGIARGTIYGTGYIENGTSVLLYTYGFAGYLSYLITILSFSILFLLKRNVFYAGMFFYIYIVAQQFTHEFYSSTIYLQLTVFLLIFNQLPKIERQDRLFPFAQ